MEWWRTHTMTVCFPRIELGFNSSDNNVFIVMAIAGTPTLLLMGIIKSVNKQIVKLFLWD